MVQGAAALGSAANRNFISNAAFVITTEGVVVVDALGSPALATELLQAIARLTPQPVRHVIVTHYHADHIYGLQVFKAAGATITAHRSAQAYLHSDTAALRLRTSRETLFPWVQFVLQPAGPAHTVEDLVVVLPQQQLLMAGDLVFRGRIPFVGTADSGRWVQALQSLLALGVHTIVPGHGPVSQDARADLQLTADYLQHLRNTMGEAARTLEPFEDAYAKADWSRFEHLPLFKAANRINAYNTYLHMEQAVMIPAAPPRPAP
jgi:glyoxylase-like metal-dependent hydrolase (beta-lactamase superfamily II)